MGYRLIEYKGKLAATLGWATDQETPARSRAVLVSDIATEQYEGIIGMEVTDLRGCQGLIRVPGATHPVHIDLGNRAHIVESQPIDKPRRGKRQGARYDWEWVRGQWERTCPDD